MKIVLSLLILSIVCVSCGKKPEGTKVSETLSLNLAADPDCLDPRVVRSLRDLSLVKQLFEGLMRMDKDGKPQPAMASSFEVSEDKLTYIFHLRDANWTNGDPVTASDFLYSWKTVLDPKFPTDYAHMLFPLKNGKKAKKGECSLDEIGVRAPDEKTLVVELENPTPYFLELAAFPTSFPTPSKVAQIDNSWCLPPGEKFVSNGPFSLKKWAPDISLELVKNETYWDKEQVHLTTIAFSVVSDNMTEGFLYEKGELDWLGQPLSNNISAELSGKLRETGNLNSYLVAGTFWLKYNTQVVPFDHPKIRKALSYAVKRENIIKHILRGGQVSAQEILPPSMALHKAPLFEDGDLPLAKLLFKEVCEEKGWTSETFPKITLSYNPSERNTKIAQFIADEWHKTFGIEVALEAIELKCYRQNCKMGKFMVGTGEWIADFNDPVSFLDLFQYRNDDKSGNGMNDTGWHNEEYSTLLEMAMKETSVEKRNAFLAKAEEILMDEMPIAPLYHYSFDYVKRGEIKEVVLSPIGPVDFKYATKSSS